MADALVLAAAGDAREQWERGEQRSGVVAGSSQGGDEEQRGRSERVGCEAVALEDCVG